MASRSRPIDGELLKLKNEIRECALSYGLDFFEVMFEVCDYDTINILASLGGFPSRYPHWRFGMDYDQMSKGYAYGLQKIYEMVINTDPSYAYLLQANHLVDQKIVIAHVYGHSDFFKNNIWFKNTNRKMMDVMANNGAKVRRYMELYGEDALEIFIDKVLSLENLIDVDVLFETPEVVKSRQDLEKLAKEELNKDSGDERSSAVKTFIRSQDKLKDPKAVIKTETKEEYLLKIPERPTRDIMKFLGEHAPLEEWQKDVIGIIREEAYYFLPQRLTKIMNEGWASYWHAKIMTEKVLRSSEIIDFCDHHAGVMAMSKQNLNPYKIGIELYRDIEYRWNTGRFGKEYNECEDMVLKQNWDKKLNQGRAKIFEVRKSHNDLTFIDEFLTPEFCERAQLFTYKYNPRTGRTEIDTRDFLAIKQKLLGQLTNFGSPVIELENANYENRGESLLVHKHYGVDLDLNYCQETMKNIHALWKRPVNMVTRYDDKETVFVYDGKEMRPKK
ncbi:MAG: SpoVR family protein [Bacteriovoracaceae bacterium]